MKPAYRQDHFHPMPIWISLLILVLAINVHLIPRHGLSNFSASEPAILSVLTQIPAQAQVTELRIQRISQGIRTDHSFAFGFPVRAERFDEGSAGWFALNQTNANAFSSIYLPNLHDRAPPFLLLHNCA
jgi:hypothetical protein